MSEQGTRLDAVLDEVWHQLARGVSDASAPARTLVLATSGAEGGEARMVVLRGSDRAADLLLLHTDALSPKVAELRADPRATLLAWDPQGHLQIRMRVTATVTSADPALWDALPETARRAYGGTPPPGTPMDAPGDWRAAPERHRMAEIACRIREIDVLHLAAPAHRRALFSRADGRRHWTGQWIAP